jgi:hypothetical protein
VTVAETTSLIAVFTRTSGSRCILTITVSPADGGDTTPAPGQHEYDQGTTVELLAKAAGGFHFERWDGPVAEPFLARTSIELTRSSPVPAHFTPNVTYTLAVDAAGDGVGRLRLNGQLYPLPFHAEFDAGARLSLEAVPDAGSVFAAWEGDLSGDQNPTGISMDRERNVTIRFAPAPVVEWTLTIEAADGGTTDPPPGTYTFPAGVRIPVRALPLAGWRFSTWLGSVVTVENPVPVLMDADRTLTPVFSQFGYPFNRRWARPTAVPRSRDHPS